nr:MAG TPA: hypothetical protein [Caudoviricetes sp.]
MGLFYVYVSSGYYMEVGGAIYPNNKMFALREHYRKGYFLDSHTKKVAMHWGMTAEEIENVNNGELYTPHKRGK